MKITTRDEWRVMATIKPTRPDHLGLTGVKELAEFVAPSGPITIAVVPRRLGDFGFIKMNAARVSSDIEGDYRRRCEEIAAELSRLPHVEEATVACTETHTCSHCRYGWEVLTADEIAAHPDMVPDGYSAPGEPVCCEKAIAEFRAERGIPALAEAGDPR
jgi:hypothetical protein